MTEEEITAAPEAGAGADSAAPSEPSASPQPPEPRAARTVDETLDAVFGSLDEADAASEAAGAETAADGEGGEAETAAVERERDKRGRFVSKDQKTGAETAAEQPEGDQETAAEPEKTAAVDPAPASLNLSPEAKAGWEKADPALRADVSRRVSEIETGLQQYQAAFEPLRQYADLAHRAGKDLPSLLGEYHQAEQMLHQDPVGGVRHLIGLLQRWNPNLSVEDVAMKLLDGPDEAQGDPRVAQLQQRIDMMERHSQEQVARQQQAQGRALAEQQIQAFRAQHPRFDELAQTIAEELRSTAIPANLPLQQRLLRAYQRAEMLNPAAPQIAPQAPPAQPSPQAARTRVAAQRSISGAPASGSDPARRPRSKTVDDALDRALNATGI